ncbi:MAG TPA: pyridoxal phosphate-dependent aminotransferase [Terriglobales bacterium]|nr:pyridoxal phosphate-dependent aminotransferase [Terriglobales bacterium]
MFSSRTKWNLTPNRFSATLNAHRAAGRELFDLTESNPTRCGFNYDPRLLESLIHPAGLEYHPDPCGLREAREAVTRYYAERGTVVDRNDVILTASTSEAYTYIFRLLCDPREQVLVPAPSYPLFEFLASLQDLSLVPYRLFYDYGWHLDLHSVTSAITARSRAVIVVHPNNPTGSFLGPEEMRGLDMLCAERSLALIADEVFLDYAHDGLPRPSFAAANSALSFTLSGLSKIAALPQMKLAWLVLNGPPELKSAALQRLEVIADTYLSVSTPLQLALPSLLAGRHAIQKQICRRLTENLTELDRQLASHSHCHRLEVEGGWYSVLRVPATRPDEDLAIALLEERGVLVHPGHFYDFPDDGYFVLSLITPPDTFRAGMRRLLEFLG